MLNIKKMEEKRLLDENIMPNNFVDQLINVKIKHGINASTISDMSGIPRATVIRKLNKLLKEKFLTIDKKKHYTSAGLHAQKLLNVQNETLNNLSKFSARNYNLSLMKND